MVKTLVVPSDSDEKVETISLVGMTVHLFAEQEVRVKVVYECVGVGVVS